MSNHPISFKLFGDQSILVEWPAKVDESILYDILVFSEHLKSERLDNSTWELIPAYNSLTLVHRNKINAPAEFIQQLRKWYSSINSEVPLQRQLWKLPVCYESEFGIDLKEVSEILKMSVQEIIDMHTSHTYTVYGIGFLPGFMYLGGLPKELEVPRREVPRLKVVKGSVGLVQ